MAKEKVTRLRPKFYGSEQLILRDDARHYYSSYFEGGEMIFDTNRRTITVPGGTCLLYDTTEQFEENCAKIRHYVDRN